jgi:uncharacterized protein YgbK (DUF1537 family)
MADDLTGALDTAGGFVTRFGPLPVFWDSFRSGDAPGSCALDTQTRSDDAPPLAPPALEVLAGADLAFKKIDSLLRGETAAEIALCLQSGQFRSAVIAPAFPAQQRITRDGRQYWRQHPSQPWELLSCDLAAELAALGVELAKTKAPCGLPGRGFVLCDAETEADLSALVAAGQRLEKPVLWCGTAGLARTLAGVTDATEHNEVAAPLLIVIGTKHPVSTTQLAALAEHDPDVVVRMCVAEREAIEPTLERLAQRLDAGVGVLAFTFPPETPSEVAGPTISSTFDALARTVAQPKSLAVTGGGTLFRLMQALQSVSLTVHDELTPGVPRSRIEGGRWHGSEVISKSGAFGDPQLLIRLAESAKAGSHE